MKRAKRAKKNSQGHHRIILISVFVVIVLVALLVLLQSTSLKTIAGEAIRQRVEETKQLALTKEQIKINEALLAGKKTIAIECPPALKSSAEQHWMLEEDWKFRDLKNVDVFCESNVISCYYADGESELNRADQIVIYDAISNVKDCQKMQAGKLGCDCEILSAAPTPGQPSPTGSGQ